MPLLFWLLTSLLGLKSWYLSAPLLAGLHFLFSLLARASHCTTLLEWKCFQTPYKCAAEAKKSGASGMWSAFAARIVVKHNLNLTNEKHFGLTKQDCWKKMLVLLKKQKQNNNNLLRIKTKFKMEYLSFGAENKDVLLVKAALFFYSFIFLDFSNLCVSEQLSAFLVSIHQNHMPNNRNEDICSDLSIMLSASDSWWNRKDVLVQKKKRDRMQNGGWTVLADLNNMTDAQVRGFRGCVLCVCVCLHMSGYVYYSACSCAPPQ